MKSKPYSTAVASKSKSVTTTPPRPYSAPKRSNASHFKHTSLAALTATYTKHGPSPGKSTQSGTESTSLIMIRVQDDEADDEATFVCQRGPLLHHMGYFKAHVTPGTPSQDLDISVRCDMHVFKWLINWVKSTYDSSIVPPSFTPSMAVSVLVSSEFLQMASLLPVTLDYIASVLPQVVSLRLDLSCISDPLVNKLAAVTSLETLENVPDPAARLVPRIWDAKLASAPSSLPLAACISCSRVIVTTHRPTSCSTHHAIVPGWSTTSALHALSEAQRQSCPSSRLLWWQLVALLSPLSYPSSPRDPEHISVFRTLPQGFPQLPSLEEVIPPDLLLPPSPHHLHDSQPQPTVAASQTNNEPIPINDYLDVDEEHLRDEYDVDETLEELDVGDGSEDEEDSLPDRELSPALNHRSTKSRLRSSTSKPLTTSSSSSSLPPSSTKHALTPALTKSDSASVILPTNSSQTPSKKTRSKSASTSSRKTSSRPASSASKTRRKSSSAKTLRSSSSKKLSVKKPKPDARPGFGNGKVNLAKLSPRKARTFRFEFQQANETDRLSSLKASLRATRTPFKPAPDPAPPAASSTVTSPSNPGPSKPLTSTNRPSSSASYSRSQTTGSTASAMVRRPSATWR